MPLRFKIALILGVFAAVGLPTQGEADEDFDASTPPPFAGDPLSIAELDDATAVGSTNGMAAWGRESTGDVAVILWDELKPPRGQSPAPRPGPRTEIRQGGRLLFKTVSAPR